MARTALLGHLPQPCVVHYETRLHKRAVLAPRPRLIMAVLLEHCDNWPRNRWRSSSPQNISAGPLPRLVT
jgi:hypothetical protein